MIEYDGRNFLGVAFTLRGAVLPRLASRLVVVALVGVAAASLHARVGVKIPSLLHTLIGVALGLLLVFRTNASYDRWWEGRKLLGMLVNRTRDFTRQVATFVPADAHAADRDLLQRWVVLFYRLACQGLRKERDLAALGDLITPAERASLEPVDHRAIEVQLWISKRVNALVRARVLTDEQQRLLDGNLTSWSDSLGACERIAKTPLPLAYAQHTKLLVTLFCLTAPFAIVDALRWATPVGAVALTFALLGVDEIGVEVEDPFGYDANDLPLDAIGATVERNTRQLVASSEQG